MVPLRVVVVVVVVQVSPPSVIMRKDGRDEEDGHVESELPLGQQRDEVFRALVQGNDPADHQDPHFNRVLCGIEVHVLVRGHPTLVRAFVDSVPAGAGTVALVHVAGVGLPEAPEDVDMCRQDNGRQEGAEDHPH